MAQNLDSYTGVQSPDNVDRIYRQTNDELGKLHMIGKDNGWNRWSITPDHPDYGKYLALIGDVDDKWIR